MTEVAVAGNSYENIGGLKIYSPTQKKNCATEYINSELASRDWKI